MTLNVSALSLVKGAFDNALKRESNVMSHHFEVGVIQKVQDVVLCAGKEIINTNDVITFLQQTFTEMRAEKTCSTCNKGPFSIIAH